MNGQGLDLRPVFSPYCYVCHKTRSHLAPVPSRVPSPRQRILRITGGIGFLGDPTPQRHPAWPPTRPFGREPLRVTPFRVSILRDPRTILYAVSLIRIG
jgi:hypothetical protein